MNIVMCGENCRWQNDGSCTLEDITRITCAAGSKCCYFEQKKT